MIDINSASVSDCGFPEQYLFWALVCSGLAAGLMSFAISHHTKEKYDGVSFISPILALFSDNFFEDMGKVGLIYRLCFWLAVIAGLVLYGGVDMGLLDCDGQWSND